MAKFDYKAAGVDIEAGAQAINNVKSDIASTFSSAVLTDIGGFGASYDLKGLLQAYDHPVMVQSIDGVGTKTMLAQIANNYSYLGQDLLSAACNDIVVMGAKPLTFLDYIASDRLNPDVVQEIILGMVTACKASAVSLVGGETAEMPSIYHQSEHDLVGVITGVVEKSKMITGKAIKPGDRLLGLSSSGLHTNGYSLARKLFFEENFYAYDEEIPALGDTLENVLLAPHVNYSNCIHALLDQGIEIHGMAHITGGGFIENIPRILPENCVAEIQKGAWPVQPVFTMMQKLGELEDADMYQTFNMGIGLVMVVDPSLKSQIEDKIKQFDETTLFDIGEVVSGDEKAVRFKA